MHKVNDDVSITKAPSLSLYDRTIVQRSYSSRIMHRTSLSCGESFMQYSHPQPSAYTAFLQTPTYITGRYHLPRTSLMQRTHALNPRAPRYPGYPSPIFPHPPASHPSYDPHPYSNLAKPPTPTTILPKQPLGIHPTYKVMSGQVCPSHFASPKPYPYIHRHAPDYHA